MDSFWDPNTWPVDDGVRRIYLDDYCNKFVLVDAIDFQWLIQWRWTWKKSTGGKLYARRSTGNGTGTYTIYMHIEIMRRIEEIPSWEKVLVDHKDGKSWNNCRKNLRWATPRMNNLNRFGSYTEELYANS